MGRRVGVCRHHHVFFGEGLLLEVEHAAHIVHVLPGQRLGAGRGGLSKLVTEGLPLRHDCFVDRVVLAGDFHDAKAGLDEAHASVEATPCIRDAGLVILGEPPLEALNVGYDGRYLVSQEFDVLLLNLVSRPFFLFFRQPLLLRSLLYHLLINY